jgi:hypothetical protein
LKSNSVRSQNPPPLQNQYPPSFLDREVKAAKGVCALEGVNKLKFKAKDLVNGDLKNAVCLKILNQYEDKPTGVLESAVRAEVEKALVLEEANDRDLVILVGNDLSVIGSVWKL